jgi:predicted alpha/beta hydrolase family esterase
MRNESIRYLIVPGWQGSPDNHWQSHWQRSLPNSARVEQPDWLTPQRRDWVQALEQAIAAESSPVILIAHSLGCITVAHWAAQASPTCCGGCAARCWWRRRMSSGPPARRPAQLCADPAAGAAVPSQVVSSDNDPA